ncbi:helix-turn-helix domain-containing protein [Microcoleus sp. AS-A8]
MPLAESLSTAVFVKELRKRLGLTQLQFAQSLGVSFQSVNRWERGKTKPLPIVLKLLEMIVKEMGDRSNRLRRSRFRFTEAIFCTIAAKGGRKRVKHGEPVSWHRSSSAETAVGSCYINSTGTANSLPFALFGRRTARDRT